MNTVVVHEYSSDIYFYIHFSSVSGSKTLLDSADFNAIVVFLVRVLYKRW